LEAGAVRRAEIAIRFSEFEIPPMQDVLLVGRRAAIGPEAARRMIDALSPEQYDIVRVEHPVVEAVVVRKFILRMVPPERFIPLLLEEVSPIISEEAVIKAQVRITIHVSREVEL
jgi:hypothetical protein